MSNISISILMHYVCVSLSLRNLRCVKKYVPKATTPANHQKNPNWTSWRKECYSTTNITGMCILFCSEHMYLYVYNLYFGWSLLTNRGLCLWFGLRFTHLSAHAGCGAYLQLLAYAVNEANWHMFFFLTSVISVPRNQIDVLLRVELFFLTWLISTN